MLKTCSKCKESKDLSEFSKDKSRKDGLTVWCKICKKVYRQINKKAISDKNKAFRESHRESIVDYQKTYYQTHKKLINAKAKAKASSQNHKNFIDACRKEYYRAYEEHKNEITPS